jgi:hypothetical protein
MNHQHSENFDKLMTITTSSNIYRKLIEILDMFEISIFARNDRPFRSEYLVPIDATNELHTTNRLFSMINSRTMDEEFALDLMPPIKLEFPFTKCKKPQKLATQMVVKWLQEREQLLTPEKVSRDLISRAVAADDTFDAEMTIETSLLLVVNGFGPISDKSDGDLPVRDRDRIRRRAARNDNSGSLEEEMLPHSDGDPLTTRLTPIRSQMFVIV